MIIYQRNGLTVHQLLLNDITTNCFIVQKGTDALLIDPVDKPDVIIGYLKQHALELKFMLSTHGHFDHVFAAADIIEAGVVDTLYIHEKDFSEVETAKLYATLVFKRKFKKPRMSMFENKCLSFLEYLGIRIEHAGGHTSGSCFLYETNKDFIITGDLALNHRLQITLFDRRENKQEFLLFIEKVKKSFRPDTVIFPGHGDMTTVATELEKNKKWIYIQEVCHGH